MGTTGHFLASDHDPASDKRAARVRRILLEQVRFAITTEPAAVEYQSEATPGSLTNIRGRVSITLGTIAVRLNQEGFAQSDRLYMMRDTLAEGRPVERDDIEWLNSTIASESSVAKGSIASRRSAGYPAR